MLLGADDRWPAFVRPKEDELLSCWLLRNSHAHLLKVHTFCRVVWPRLAFWNRDIDRMALPAVWQLMARKTGVSSERSYQTTLAAYEGVLFRGKIPLSNSVWIMPLGIYHRTYTRHGIQFCPSCLERDGAQPYYRRWWRLSLAVSCPVCQCSLLDECPFCEQPVVFHRSEVGHKNELAAYPLSHCTTCYADLAALQAGPVSLRLARFQSHWHARVTTIEGGHNRCEYFEVLHQLAMLLASKKPSLLRFQQAVSERAGVEFRQPAGGADNRFALLRLADRCRLLEQVAWLMEEWPSRLYDVIRQTNTRLSSILLTPENLPSSFVNLVLSIKKDQ